MIRRLSLSSLRAAEAFSSVVSEDHYGADSVRWSLERIYPALDDPGIAADERAAQELVTRLQADRGKITSNQSTPADVLRIIEDYERFAAISDRLLGFGYLQAHSDHGDAQRNALHARLQEAQQRWSADLLFIEVELRRLPEARLAKLIADPLLRRYRHFLARQAAQARYTLSEPEERIIVKKNIAGRSAVVRFREEFAANMDFGRLEIDGQEREVTESDLAALRFHPQAETRERARIQLFETYRRHLDVFAFAYTSVVKDHAIECELRGFARPMDAENVPNEIDGAVVDALIAVNRDRSRLIHDFYGWKAQRLGQKKLKTSDLYVPLVDSPPRKIRWEEATGWIDRAMSRFSPDFAARGRRFSEELRIDAPPRRGKGGGAFCYPVPERDPFVFVNYTGDVSSAITLAHELGHGIHFMLSWESQPLLQAYWMSKVMAETASEFNELLLIDLLLDELTDSAIRRSLLSQTVDRFMGTVDRQLMFTEFEEAVHGRGAGSPLQADFLNDTWVELLRAHYGPHVDLLPPEHAGWSAVPHFVFNPFYCYSYALSQVVVLALYASYKERGRDFVPGYLELLRSGGSGTPQELLARAGVDLSDRRVLERAYDECERLMAALRKEVGD